MIEILKTIHFRYKLRYYLGIDIILNIALVMSYWMALYTQPNGEKKNKRISFEKFDSYATFRSAVKFAFKFDFDDFQIRYPDQEDLMVDMESEDDFNNVKGQNKLKVHISISQERKKEIMKTRKPKKEEKGDPQTKEDKKWDPQQDGGEIKRQNSGQERKTVKKEEQKPGQEEIKEKKPSRPPPNKEDLMLKIGDKPIDAKYKKSTSMEDFYFACKICQNEYADGPRYRCDKCPNYDICHNCFKENGHKDENQYREHDFIYIQDRHHWDGINFRDLFDAFVDPYFAWYDLDPTKDKITQKDILTDSKFTKELMQKHYTFYAKKLKKYSQKWMYRFQEREEIRAVLRKKKKEQEDERRAKQEMDKDDYDSDDDD